MTDRYADLHIHTIHSDSTLSPDEVVDIALKKGLSAIAITDHDCVDGIAPALRRAEGRALEVIPGVELSAEIDGAELHILGYFIEWREPWFVKKLEEMRKVRTERIRKMTSKLRDFGLDIEPEKVFKLSGPGSVGRLHLAMALYKEGVTSSVKEAFNKYIGDKAPCNVKKFRLDPEEAIYMILKSGGVPVLAHPRVLGRDDLIPGLVKKGIRGIEVYHTDHPRSAALRYKDIASQYGLIGTGGSDCHGAGKVNVLIGTTKVPYSVVEDLRKDAEGARESKTR